MKLHESIYGSIQKEKLGKGTGMCLRLEQDVVVHGGITERGLRNLSEKQGCYCPHFIIEHISIK